MQDLSMAPEEGGKGAVEEEEGEEEGMVQEGEDIMNGKGEKEVEQEEEKEEEGRHRHRQLALEACRVQRLVFVAVACLDVGACARAPRGPVALTVPPLSL